MKENLCFYDGDSLFMCGGCLRSEAEQRAHDMSGNFLPAMFMCKHFERDGIGTAANWGCRHSEIWDISRNIDLCKNSSANAEALLDFRMEEL